MYKIKHFVILFSVILSLSCSLIGKPTEIVYLIPEDFVGGVIIAYNQPDGITPVKNENNELIYPIPPSGVLKVKPPLMEGAYKFNYYFVDEQGNRTPIEYLYPRYYVRNPGDTTSRSLDMVSEDESENKVFAIFHRTIAFSSHGEKSFLYTFGVGTPKGSGIQYIRTLDKIDELEKILSGSKSQLNN